MSETTKQKVKMIMVQEKPYIVSLEKIEIGDNVIVTVAGQHGSFIKCENETIYNLVTQNKLSSNQAYKVFMEPDNIKFQADQIEKILENDGVMEVEFENGVYKYSI
jgi:hypothetical protein